MFARAVPPLEAPNRDSFFAALLLSAESTMWRVYMLGACMSILARSMKFIVDYLLGASIYLLMKQKAPASVEALTRAVSIRIAEADTDRRKPIIELQAVELNRRFHSDLSFLPNRMPQIR